MNTTFSAGHAVLYALLAFVIILLVGLLLGEFYVPIKQWASGHPADFAGHLEQVDFTRRISVALIGAVALTLLKYRREKAKQKSDSEQK